MGRRRNGPREIPAYGLRPDMDARSLGGSEILDTPATTEDQALFTSRTYLGLLFPVDPNYVASAVSDGPSHDEW
jgi:hypothetical protein